MTHICFYCKLETMGPEEHVCDKLKAKPFGYRFWLEGKPVVSQRPSLPVWELTLMAGATPVYACHMELAGQPDLVIPYDCSVDVSNNQRYSFVPPACHC